MDANRPRDDRRGGEPRRRAMTSDMERFAGRCARSVVAAALLVALAVSCSSRPHDVETAARHRALAEWLAGAVSVVPASPELCAIAAGSSESAAVTSGPRTETGWYWERGGCTVAYALDPESVIGLADASWSQSTTATAGRVVDVDRIAHASELVRALATSLERESPAPLHRLEIQTLLWELAATVADAKRTSSAAASAELEALEHDLERAIAFTLLTEAELDSLPSALGRVGQANAGAAELIARIERQDPTVLEVTNAQRGIRSLHDQLLADRFALRVFLVVPAARVEALLRHLARSSLVTLTGFEKAFPGLPSTHASDNQQLLVLTRFVIPDVRAVLVLYFRAIDSRRRVRTTPVVAAWREMAAPGPLAAGRHATLDVLARTEIREIEYLRGFGDALARYAERDARTPFFGSLAATRVPTGRFVTTHRAQCIACHGAGLKVFGPFNWVAGSQPSYEITPPRPLPIGDLDRSWDHGRVVSAR